jgi:ribokinase
MADEPTPTSAAIALLLAKIRGRHGLAPSSGRSAKLESLNAALFKMPATEHIRPEDRSEMSEVLTHAVRRLSTDLTPYNTASTPLIIADAIFALGLLTETYRQQKVDRRIVRGLFSGQLGERRTALSIHWETLHRAVDGACPSSTPTTGTLRKTLEKQLLSDLAQLLILAVDPSTEGEASPSADNRPPQIAVVGGVTTDLTLSVEAIPLQETSSEAIARRYSPGGKGLLQAVAAARLGASSTLIAAVADDPHGRRIIDVLTKEKVDVAHLKTSVAGTSSMTYVIEESGGTSIAVNVRGDAVLTAADIRNAADLLSSQDGLLVTFEIPPTTLKALLGLTQLRQQHRPVIVVTPGQPYLPRAGLDRLALRGVDCLVARNWELARLFPNERDLSDEQLVDYFLQAGVGVVCLMDRQGCTVHCADDRSVFRAIISPRIPRNSSVARDAFCAALIIARCSAPGPGWQEAVKWATAAMARTAQEFADLIDADLDPGDGPASDDPGRPRILTIESLPDRDLVDSRLPAVVIEQIQPAAQPLASAVGN